MTFPMSDTAHHGEKPERASDKQGNPDPRITPNSAVVIDCRAKHASGLSNGEVVQLRMLARALHWKVTKGISVTRDAFTHRCFLYWMERAGVDLSGKRPAWKTKERLLRQHWGALLD